MKFKKDDLIRGIEVDRVGDAVIQVIAVNKDSYDLKWIYPDQDNRAEEKDFEFIDLRFKIVPDWYLKERRVI